MDAAFDGGILGRHAEGIPAHGMEHIVAHGAAKTGDHVAHRGAADEIALVAVSKTFGAEAIEPVIVAGQTVFGENRVQEAKAKWPPLLDRHPGLKLHLVGPLQTNKAAAAVQLFDAIHTLDRSKL